MFITCQTDLDFGEHHNTAMDASLRKSFFKSLTAPRLAGVQKFLRDNAIYFIVWACGFERTPDEWTTPSHAEDQFTSGGHWRRRELNEAERERGETGGGEHDYRIQWSRKREWRLGRWFDLLGPMEEESKEHRASARARAMPQPQTKATKSTRSWGKTRSGEH